MVISLRSTAGVGEDEMGPRRLDEVIDDAARLLAANEKYRDGELLALRAALMLVIAALDQTDPRASGTIARLLADRAETWRTRHPAGDGEVAASAIERLADDIRHRLPRLPPPEPD